MENILSWDRKLQALYHHVYSKSMISSITKQMNFHKSYIFENNHTFIKVVSFSESLSTKSNTTNDIVPGGGHWPRKGVWGCAVLKTPFSRLSRSSQGSHYKQKSLKSVYNFFFWEKFGNFSPYNLNFCPNFSSQDPQIWRFQYTRPLFQR